MKTLMLPLKRKWFEKVKDGSKLKEYRLDNEYWRKRLVGKSYDQIVLTLGYPKQNDTEKRITRTYRGYAMETVVSEEWNNEPKHVFAITL